MKSAHTQIAEITNIFFGTQGLLSAEDANSGKDSFARSINNSAFQIRVLDRELVELLQKSWSRKVSLQKSLGNIDLSKDIAAVATVLLEWNEGCNWCCVVMHSTTYIYLLVLDWTDKKLLASYRHFAAGLGDDGKILPD